MDTNLKNKIPRRLIFSLLFFFCGSCFFGPNPEDLSDFPDTLPDNFLLAACPDEGFTNVEDLSVLLTSPNAPTVEVDGNTAIKLVHGDAEPKTVFFEVHHINQQTIPRDTVNFDQDHRFMTGIEILADGTRVVDEDIGQAFSWELFPPAWHDPASQDLPILTQGFIPGHVNEGENDPNPDFDEIGLEGCLYGFPPPCPGLTRLNPGVHRIAVRFVDNDGFQHCTKYSMSIIVCPVENFEVCA